MDDHCRALDLLIERGRPGDTYNVGGGNEMTNLDLTRRILDLLDRPASLIQPVADRPGHDRRYCLASGKLRALGWRPRVAFDRGLKATVDWYVENESWWRPIKDGSPAWREYYERQYPRRG